MRALLSVSDKTGLIPFAKALLARGFEIVSTGGTAKAIQQAGLLVLEVADVTGFPEMMDGRVKTLHPKVHAGILARRQRAGDMAALAAHEITAIDLVVVNLYPFAKVAAKRDVPLEALIEEVDIGGPSLLRAAAKNFNSVTVIVDPEDYNQLLEWWDEVGETTLAFRFDLARKAIAHTADYDRVIAETLAEFQIKSHDGGMDFVRERIEFPTIRATISHKVRDLRYGENPHQRAAWYAMGNVGFGRAQIHQGKELSFTNLLDLDAAARIVREFQEPAAVVIKHTNSCGVATAPRLATAYELAREADSKSAFGGIVGLNQQLDVATATAIAGTFIECVVAPGVDPGALKILSRKPNLRVITANFADLEYQLEVRSILGGLLVQQGDYVMEAQCTWPTNGLRVVTKRQPTPTEWEQLRFAWRVCAHVKSNAIVLTQQAFSGDLIAPAQVTYGVGGGQPNRVSSALIAGGALLAERRQGQECVAASDAFFPFRDGLDAVVNAGATAVVQPGGSTNDQESIDAADEHGIAMVFTGIRHFKH